MKGDRDPTSTTFPALQSQKVSLTTHSQLNARLDDARIVEARFVGVPYVFAQVKATRIVAVQSRVDLIRDGTLPQAEKLVQLACSRPPSIIVRAILDCFCIGDKGKLGFIRAVSLLGSVHGRPFVVGECCASIPHPT